MSTLADWTPGQAEPPDVRIGVVLPGDAATRLELTMPEAPYDLAGEIPAVRSLRAGKVEYAVAGDAVRAIVDGHELGQAASWTLAPSTPANDPAASAIRIGDLVSGRGFHWQSRTSQSLPGKLTVKRGGDSLLLVCRLPIEAYLAGVITSEMSGESPPEFLKAQCVVARSWTLAAAERKHADFGIDLCNDDCCQRYQGLDGMTEAARRAVEQTCGIALVADDGRVVDANYSKCCGGIVESAEHVWGRPKPGLAALVDAPESSKLQDLLPVNDDRLDAYLAGDDSTIGEAYCSPASVSEAELQRCLGRVDRDGGFFRWHIAHERAELEEILRTKGFAPNDAAELVDVQVTQRGISGRGTTMELVYGDAHGERTPVVVKDQYDIRRALHRSFLFSSAFRVRVERDGRGKATRFHFDGAGWGHGVGLCQIGALGMALAGHDHRSILHHYFPQAGLESVYD